jgi:hypothetical protein
MRSVCPPIAAKFSTIITANCHKRLNVVLVMYKAKQPHYRPGGPLGFQEVEAHRFIDNRYMKVVRLSALSTGCLYPQEIFLVLISVRS